MIPYATHSVDIERPAGVDEDAASYGLVPDSGPVVVATEEPACITRLAVTTNQFGGQQEGWILLLNPEADLRRFDVVTDRLTGQRYTVEAVSPRIAAGPAAQLNHIRADLSVSAL